MPNSNAAASCRPGSRLRKGSSSRPETPATSTRPTPNTTKTSNEAVSCAKAAPATGDDDRASATGAWPTWQSSQRQIQEVSHQRETPDEPGPPVRVGDYDAVVQRPGARRLVELT